MEIKKEVTMPATGEGTGGNKRLYAYIQPQDIKKKKNTPSNQLQS